MIVELASKGSKAVVDACPLDGELYEFPYLPLRGVYHLRVVYSFASTESELIYIGSSGCMVALSWTLGFWFSIPSSLG